MFIRPRQVRRSKKFTTHLQTGARQRREYAATTYSAAVVKAMLAGFMVVLAVKVYQAFAIQASSVSLTLRLAIPVLIVAGALLVARSCVNNIRAVREFSQYKRSRRDP
jgi:ABC-type nickel/cobalt efflux system permease component RcnA